MQFILFICLFLFLVSAGRFVSISDPIIRSMLLPIVGFSYLITSAGGVSLDFITLILCLAWVLIISAFFSTPRKIKPTPFFTSNFIYIIKILAITSALVFLADVTLNIDLSKSIFFTSSFDVRGDLRFPQIRFISYGLGFIVIPLLAISKRIRSKSFSCICLVNLVLFCSLFLATPGKGFIVFLVYLALDYNFWEKLQAPATFLARPILSYRLRLYKPLLIQVLAIGVAGSIVIILTIFSVSLLLHINLKESSEFLSYRLFNISYDLAFSVVDDPLVEMDYQSPPPEFSTVFELWLKPFAKLFGRIYSHDTIPKYIQYLMTGNVTYGVSSPNSNLFMETTTIHGRYPGLLLVAFITSIGSLCRYRYLNTGNPILLLLFPAPISMGPLFCFQDSQSFFAAYLAYLLILIFAILSVNLFRTRKFL